MTRLRATTFAAVVAGLVAACPAPAEPAPLLRLAAPSDCLTNPGCGVGLARHYRIDVASALTPLAEPGSGIGALDDGTADVAVVFSSDPRAGRPDLLQLKDDRGMLGPENLVPVIRSRTLRAYGRGERALRRRLATVGRLLSTTGLRALNQLAIDGRMPEAIAGDWVEGHGLLAARPAHRRGPSIRLGYQAFAESETVTRVYEQVLASAGYDARSVPVHGFRQHIRAAFLARRIDGHISYATSLLRFLQPSSTATSARGVRRALAVAGRRAGLDVLPFARAQDRNLFVMTRATASRLNVIRLSDLERYWPTHHVAAP